MLKISKIFLLGLLSLNCGCSFLKNYKNDNIAEEILESIIKNETGYDIDLSYDSPENGNKK